MVENTEKHLLCYEKHNIARKEKLFCSFYFFVLLPLNLCRLNSLIVSKRKLVIFQKIMKIDSVGCCCDIPENTPTLLPHLAEELFQTSSAKTACKTSLAKFHFCWQMICYINTCFCSDDKNNTVIFINFMTLPLPSK